MMNRSVKIIGWILIGLGVCFRFYNIQLNHFFYYDEGMYLTNNLQFLQQVHRHPPQNFPMLLKFFSWISHLALSDTKSIWCFLLYMRTLFLAPEAWYYGRILSAIFGSLSIGLTYLVGKRLFNSKEVGFISAVLLAILPSHIFYSRLAMQEALSTFFLLLAVYYYISSEKFSWRTILSGFFLGCVYYTNYRMIIAPAIIFIVELLLSFAARARFDLRKYVWQTVAFLACVFGIGGLDGGAHTFIVFSWMFHQSELAHGHFNWINFLSYPYYIFSFETVLFGLFFFGGLVYLLKKDWRKFLPFAVVLFQMIVFSFPQEKGVRYLCVVMPFMAMTAALVLMDLGRYYSEKGLSNKFLLGVVALMCSNQLMEAATIINFRTSYEQAINNVPSQYGIIASQPLVQKLYAKKNQKIADIPSGGWPYYVAYLKKGYRFIMIGPQAYVSNTLDHDRFTYELQAPLEYIKDHAQPVKTYSHFSPQLLKRFVMEHNENLSQSLDFLRDNRKQKFNQLYIYDLQQIVFLMFEEFKKNKPALGPKAEN